MANDAATKASSKDKKAPAWTLEVPCRPCSDRARKEIRWPLRCFLANLTQRAAWEQLSQGQHLQCYRCCHQWRKSVRTPLLMCKECRDLCRRGRFSTATQARWDTHDFVGQIVCRHRTRIEEPAADEPMLPATTPPPPSAQWTCTQCWQTWPEGCFPVDQLKLNESCGLLSLLCWACFLQNEKPQKFAKHNDLQCRTCKWTHLTLRDFPPLVVREMLHTHLRRIHKEKKDGIVAPFITCTDCAFPLCSTGCGARKPTVVLGPNMKQRRWFCDVCTVKVYQCTTCVRSFPLTEFQASTIRAESGLCYTCCLSEPQHWSGRACAACGRTNLTLFDFRPMLAKEILEQQRFRWNTKRRICTACVTEGH